MTPTQRPASSFQASDRKTSSPSVILAGGRALAIAGATVRQKSSAKRAAILAGLDKLRFGRFGNEAGFMPASKEFAYGLDAALANVVAVVIDVEFDMLAHDIF